MTLTDARLIDYYAILNLPPTANLVGVENAYARLSNELVYRAEVDETAVDALKLVNEAYAVLSMPNLRLEYDSEFFKAEFERQRLVADSVARRSRIMANLVSGSLAILVIVEAAGLAYLARQHLGFLFGWL